MKCEHDLRPFHQGAGLLAIYEHPEEIGYGCEKCGFEWWAYSGVSLEDALAIWERG